MESEDHATSPISPRSDLRPDDAIYPGEETKEVELEQLYALQAMVTEIEASIAILKQMIKLVVSEVRFPELYANPDHNACRLGSNLCR